MADTDIVADIMVVDDTVANLRLLGELLRDRGYRVRPFPSGDLALKAAAKTPPDLILLDINMPEMNGFEVCEELKKSPELKEIPVIFISALSETLDKVNAFRSGGVDYITKPFHFEEVDARISTHLKLRTLHLQVEAQNQHLRETNEQLLELERLRDNLTNMIVHDMRNPLMVIQGYLDLLGRTIERPDMLERAARYIRDSDASTKTLIEMVSSLLDITKMESNQLELDLGNHDIAELARQSAHSMESLIMQKSLTVTAPDQELSVMARCDPRMLLRVFNNLLGNAIKFTPDGGHIEIIITQESGGAKASICDNGPGIPEEFHDRIFDKFGQVRTRSEGSKYSTGLGLTFCKMVIESHGGAVGVQSCPDNGSTFWFMLPNA